MTIIDANLLLYAYNADAPQHSAAARWLAELVQGGEPVALPWVTLWAFLRISTNPRIWDNPLPSARAFAIVNEWLALPGVVVLPPGPRHLELLERLVLEHKAAGPLVTGAILASLAFETGATLASTDQDFGRFQGLQWVNPISR